MIALKDIKRLVLKNADKIATKGWSAEDRENATGRKTDDRYPVSPFHLQMARDLCEMLGDGESIHEPLAVTLVRLFVEHEHGGTCLKLAEDDFRPTGAPCEEYLHLEHREKGDYLYLRRDWECERAVREKVKELSARSEETPAESSHAAEFVFGQTPENTKGWQYGEDQIAAVKAALANRFAIITGGPGTGKTTVVFAVLSELIKRNPGVRIALAAPTGKAAQRMAESIADSAAQVSQWPSGFDGVAIKERIASLEGTTYHRLLHYTQTTNSFTYNLENPLPYDVLIIDETSMIDLVHARNVFEAIGTTTQHVILLGDPNQLPSVDEGSVLADLLSSEWGGESRYVSALKEAKRFPDPMKTLVTEINAHVVDEETAYGKILDDKDHGIRPFDLNGVFSAVQNSREGEKKPAAAVTDAFVNDDADREGRAYVYLIPSTTDSSQARKEVRNLMEAWQIAFGRELKDLCGKYSGSEANVARIRKILRGAQILTVVRKGAWGCEGINRQVMKTVNGKEPEDDIAGVSPYVGLPIIITKNDKLLGLNNGDVGVVVRHKGELMVWIDGYSDKKKANGADEGLLPYRLLPAYEPAYAITIHKSQGSQYENVLVVLPPKNEETQTWSPLMTKELVYTGITRAKTRTFVYGSREGLCYALAHRSRRQTGRD